MPHRVFLVVIHYYSHEVLLETRHLKIGCCQVCCYLDADPEATRRLNFLKAPAASQVKVKESQPVEPALPKKALVESASPAPPLGAYSSAQEI